MATLDLPRHLLGNCFSYCSSFRDLADKASVCSVWNDVIGLGRPDGPGRVGNIVQKSVWNNWNCTRHSKSCVSSVRELVALDRAWNTPLDFVQRYSCDRPSIECLSWHDDLGLLLGSGREGKLYVGRGSANPCSEGFSLSGTSDDNGDDENEDSWIPGAQTMDLTFGDSFPSHLGEKIWYHALVKNNFILTASSSGIIGVHSLHMSETNDDRNEKSSPDREFSIRKLRNVDAHGDSVFCLLELAPSHQHDSSVTVLSGGWDFAVKVWTLSSDGEMSLLTSHDQAHHDAVWRARRNEYASNRFVTAGWDGNVFEWEITDDCDLERSFSTEFQGHVLDVQADRNNRAVYWALDHRGSLGCIDTRCSAPSYFAFSARGSPSLLSRLLVRDGNLICTNGTALLVWDVRMDRDEMLQATPTISSESGSQSAESSYVPEMILSLDTIRDRSIIAGTSTGNLLEWTLHT